MKKHLSATMKLAVLGALLSTTAFATNGMLTTARTARTAGMGGASIAVIGETGSSVDTNPANIAFATRSSLTFELGVMAPSVTGKDATEFGGKSHDASSALFPIPTFSYTYVNPDSNWAFGVGALALGGMGAKYDSMSSGMSMGPAGPAYGLHESQIGYMTLDFTATYKITPKWAVSATPFISYSTMYMKTPAVKLEDMTNIGGGIKLGTTYLVTDKWSLGATFTSEDKLNFDGKVNTPAGKADGSAEIAWPSEFGVGTAYQATDKLLLAADVKWIGWKSAMKDMKIKSDEKNLMVGQNASGPIMADNMAMPLDWDDQIVYSLGAEYKATEKLTLRAGYNYGKNPVPSSTVMPLFPAITEHHFSLGLGYDFTPSLTVNASLEMALENSQKNTSKNPMQRGSDAFGGSESTLSIMTYGLGATYKF